MASKIILVYNSLRQGEGKIFGDQRSKGPVYRMSRSQATTSFIPGRCTSYLQPLDVALNQPLKALVKLAADRHYAEHTKDCEKGRWSTMGHRRILLTHWVADTWQILHDRYKETIIKSFRRVRLSLNPDRFDDAEILIKGAEALEIEDWRKAGVEGQSQAQGVDVVVRFV